MVLGVLVLGNVAGCNTIRGVGKDVQAGGRAIERAAKN
jgi:predicted small secreted protein